jgi:hypothetical protein
MAQLGHFWQGDQLLIKTTFGRSPERSPWAVLTVYTLSSLAWSNGFEGLLWNKSISSVGSIPVKNTHFLHGHFQELTSDMCCRLSWYLISDSGFPHVRLLYHGLSHWSLRGDSIKYVCHAWIQERGDLGNVSTIIQGNGNSIMFNVGRRLNSYIFWDVSFKVRICLPTAARMKKSRRFKCRNIPKVYASGREKGRKDPKKLKECIVHNRQTDRDDTAHLV